MKIRCVILLAVCCLMVSVTAASAGDVRMTLTNLGTYGWSKYADVDSSARGGVYDNGYNYCSADDCLMFTNGRSSRTTGGSPWSVLTTNNYNGTKLSDVTSLIMRTNGLEGYPSTSGMWQPAHFILSVVTSLGNTRCMEWIPWSDGTPRDPGVGGYGADGHWNTYNAMVDGSWFCDWTSQTFSTWADMCATISSDGSGAYGNATINPSTGFGAAWKGLPFSVGYARYDSNNVDLYNNSARGCIDWFTVGVNGADTTYLLGVPEPGSILALATGLIGFLGLRRRF